MDTVKKKLCEEKPELKEKEIIFLLDDKNLDINKTLEENQIKNKKAIVINILKDKLNKGNETSKNNNNERKTEDNNEGKTEDNKEEKSEIIKENEDEEISVIIKSSDQTIKSSFMCKKSDKFKVLEQKLYKKYPNIKNEGHYYLCEGNKIDIEKTIEENKIKDNANILYINDSENEENEEINVNIESTDQNIKFSFKCKKSDKFKLVEQKLYEKYPNLKNEEHYYICNGIKIDNRRE